MGIKRKPQGGWAFPVPPQIPQLKYELKITHKIRLRAVRSGVPARPYSSSPSISGGTQLPRPLAGGPQQRPQAPRAPSSVLQTPQPPTPPAKPRRVPVPRPAPFPPNGRPRTPAQRTRCRRTTPGPPARPGPPATHRPVRESPSQAASAAQDFSASLRYAAPPLPPPPAPFVVMSSPGNRRSSC